MRVGVSTASSSWALSPEVMAGLDSSSWCPSRTAMATGSTARRASMAQRTLGLESQGRKYRKGEQKDIGVLADETRWRRQRHGLLVGRFAVSDETRPRPPHEPLLDFSVRAADLGAAPHQTSCLSRALGPPSPCKSSGALTFWGLPKRDPGQLQFEWCLSRVKTTYPPRFLCLELNLFIIFQRVGDL